MDLDTSGAGLDEDVSTQLMIEQQRKHAEVRSSFSGQPCRSKTLHTFTEFRLICAAAAAAAAVLMKYTVSLSAGSFRSLLRERRYSMR